jgi:hypothetical protein
MKVWRTPPHEGREGEGRHDGMVAVLLPPLRALLGWVGEGGVAERASRCCTCAADRWLGCAGALQCRRRRRALAAPCPPALSPLRLSHLRLPSLGLSCLSVCVPQADLPEGVLPQAGLSLLPCPPPSCASSLPLAPWLGCNLPASSQPDTGSTPLAALAAPSIFNARALCRRRG